MKSDSVEPVTTTDRDTISRIHLPPFQATSHCPKCMKECKPDENVFICEHCNTVSSYHDAIVKAKIKLTLSIKEKKIDLLCDHAIITQLVLVLILIKVSVSKQIIAMEKLK